MSRVNQLKKVLIDKNIKIQELANLIGVKRYVINNAIQRNSLSDDLIEKICKALNLEKSVFEENKSSEFKKPFDWKPFQEVAIPLNAKPNVIVLPYKVPAGYFNINQDPDWELCEKMYIPTLPPNTLHYGIHVSGESMHPTLNEGDIVICKPYNPMDGFNKNKMYVIVSQEGDSTVKRIREKEDHLVLIPDNEEHSYLTIQKKDIMQILVVIAVVKRV
ncbi:MAG: LexA family transcriptional regulator [Bacteroidia bacterium]|nr:LexA family transcriptional regulator [Bacteroidia bacterium]MDW8347005.1 LexA family transcriptional regulator [Bacteroidia bacterium]